VTPLVPGSKQLEYRDGEYLYRDIYVGMAYFVGQEVVFHRELAGSRGSAGKARRYTNAGMLAASCGDRLTASHNASTRAFEDSHDTEQEND
jgi:hypothetical protein